MYQDNSDLYTCLLATHIASAWNSPEKLQENIHRYLEKGEYDEFIYISREDHNQGNYEELADTIIPSQKGEKDKELDQVLKRAEVDYILDSFDRIVHIGGHWRRCHEDTWKDLIEGICYREEEEEYTIEMPLHLINDFNTLVSSDIDRRQKGRYSFLQNQIESSYYDVFKGFHTPIERMADHDFLGLELEFDPKPDSRLIWNINTLPSL